MYVVVEGWVVGLDLVGEGEVDVEVPEGGNGIRVFSWEDGIYGYGVGEEENVRGIFAHPFGVFMLSSISKVYI